MKILVRNALWLGPLVTLIGFISYYAFFFRYPVLRDFPWVNLPLVFLGAGLACAGIAKYWNTSGGFRKLLWVGSALFSIGLAALLSFYVFVLSYQMPGPSAVTTELSEVPDIRLINGVNDESVSLSSFRGKRVLLSFYRGYW